VDFDPSISWVALEKRLAETESPRQRALLETVIAHTRAETALDVPGLMATLVDEPAYHFWGPAGDTGPKGRDGVEQYYRAFAASGAAMLESNKERIVVDDHSVCHEGVITTLASGRIAKARGYNVDDEQAHYLLRMRAVILWSFDDDAKAFGEDSYVAIQPDDFVKVDRAELPQAYLDYLASIGQAP
jgi:hypothetical protein